VKTEDKYIASADSMMTAESEDKLRGEMIKHLVIKETIIPIISDDLKKTTLIKLLDTKPNVTFSFLLPFLEDNTLKAEFDNITPAN